MHVKSFLYDSKCPKNMMIFYLLYNFFYFSTLGIPSSIKQCLDLIKSPINFRLNLVSSHFIGNNSSRLLSEQPQWVLSVFQSIECDDAFAHLPIPIFLPLLLSTIQTTVFRRRDRSKVFRALSTSFFFPLRSVNWSWYCRFFFSNPLLLFLSANVFVIFGQYECIVELNLNSIILTHFLIQPEPAVNELIIPRFKVSYQN